MKTTMLAATVCVLMVGMTGCGGGGGGSEGDAPAEKPDAPTTAPGGGASLEAGDAGTAVALAVFENRTVKVGCGLCIYEMVGVDSCELAIHADGHSMLVTGVDMDLHDHGLCGKEGQAVVSGEVKDGVLVATRVDVQ